MKSRLIIWSLFLLSLAVKAQDFTLIKTVNITTPEAVSIDKLGKIYIADKQGNVNRYLPDGSLDITFSSQKQGHIGLIEAWNPLKTFVFYDDLQEYAFLNRFLTASESFPLYDLSDFNSLATISYDNNLWIIDMVDYSLKKYDLNYGQFTITTNFDLLLNPDDYDITFIKEYQNLVFMSDYNSGIYIFDNLGNYLRQIPTREVEYFNFQDNSIYYLSGDSLVSTDIYSLKSKNSALPSKAKFALSAESNLYLIDDEQIMIYKRP
ncbi:hypothetical protein [Fulvivirga ligni]|uniref:hypothetical protein n=1 Tax=Fulvivirga ligni TaxID=2904246 RepID=UPI001F184A95|nr:hypothetical protein [Fulvivirga ligni]UII21257.1 hypothetical protein LVD16_25825 [Fulvivirga ligni]